MAVEFYLERNASLDSINNCTSRPSQLIAKQKSMLLLLWFFCNFVPESIFLCAIFVQVKADDMECVVAVDKHSPRMCFCVYTLYERKSNRGHRLPRRPSVRLHRQATTGQLGIRRLRRICKDLAGLTFPDVTHQTLE